MAKVDLARLKTAVDTGNSDLYHGDVREGMLEALEELAEAREKLAEIQGVLTPG
jgi:hypothetical protein